MNMILRSKEKLWVDVKEEIVQLRTQIKSSRIQSNGLMYDSKCQN